MFYGIPEDTYDCKLYAPVGLETAETGISLTGAWWSPELTRIGDFTFGWEDASGEAFTTVSVWPSDSQAVVRYFDEDPDGQEYADGSVLRTAGLDMLLAVPGQDCFYELRPEFMVALSWTLDLLRPIER
jgi:hypothetical protein